MTLAANNVAATELVRVIVNYAPKLRKAARRLEETVGLIKVEQVDDDVLLRF